MNNLATDKRCPNCGGADLCRERPTYIRHREDFMGDVLQPMECENCGASWKNRFALAGYTDLQTKPKR